MPRYLTDLREAELLKELILKHANDYYLHNLVKAENIRTEPLASTFEQPAIHIVKSGGLEGNVLGDALGTGAGNFQTTILNITILNRKNTEKEYNGIYYKDDNLNRLIVSVVKQILFDHHTFESENFPDMIFLVQSMTADVEEEGLRAKGGIFISRLIYKLECQINR